MRVVRLLRVVGRVFGGEHAYGAISVIEDVDGYDEMMNHPARLEIDRIGLPLVEKFESFDISDDPDPELARELAEIHQRRFDNLPDIAELVSGIGEYTGITLGKEVAVTTTAGRCWGCVAWSRPSSSPGGSLLAWTRSFPALCR